MKKYIIFIFAVLLIFSASACSPVPESVENEMNNYDNVNHVETSREYKQFDEVKTDKKTALQNVGQLLLDGITAKLPQPDAEIYNFELNYCECDAKVIMRDILAEQFPLINIEEADSLGTDVRFCDNEKISFYCDKSNMVGVEASVGNIAFLHGKSLAFSEFFDSEQYNTYGLNALTVWSPGEVFEAKRIISLHSGEMIDNDLSFCLTDGQVPVVDAMKKAEDFLDTFLSKYENNAFKYKIRKIYVREIAQNKYGYEFVAERLYNYVPIDTTPLYKWDGADFGGEGYYVENGDYIGVWMVDSDTIDYFRCSSIKKVENVAPCNDKILSLDSALGIVSDTLTMSSSFKCMSVELLYINGYYSEKYFGYEDRDTDEKYESMLRYPRKTRLVWAVLIENPAVYPGTIDCPHDPHYTVFVDAVTGEVIGFYDPSSVYVY